jgi:hypothetical protein
MRTSEYAHNSVGNSSTSLAHLELMDKMVLMVKMVLMEWMVKMVHQSSSMWLIQLHV